MSSAPPPSVIRLPRPAGGSPGRVARGAPWPWLVRLFATAALGLSVYLAWAAMTQTTVGGCVGGEAAACDDLLASRWGKWLSLPVGLLAATVYASVLAASAGIGSRVPESVARLSWRLLLALAIVIVGAAAWFIGLQMVYLGQYCVPCLVTHGLGLLTAGSILVGGRSGSVVGPVVGGALAVAALIAGQVLVEPVDYRIATFDAPDATNPDAANNDTKTTETPKSKPSEDAPPPARTIKILGGKVTLSLDEFPTIGRPDAKFVVVELFDYTCSHCRELHGQMSRLPKELRDEMLIVLVPTPMNSVCNPYSPPAGGGPHREACAFARLALETWRAKPEAFAELHEWLIEREATARLEDAKQYAAKRVGWQVLAAQADATAQKVIDADIARCVAIFGKTTDSGGVPKLITERHVVDARFASDSQLLKVLREQLGIDSGTKKKP